jgi:hypothetical protein
MEVGFHLRLARDDALEFLVDATVERQLYHALTHCPEWTLNTSPAGDKLLARYARVRPRG